MPATGLDSDAADYLESLGFLPRFRTIRSSDEKYLPMPFRYYLERVLGIVPAFSTSASSAAGQWGHIRASLPLTLTGIALEERMNHAFKLWIAEATLMANALGIGHNALQGFIASELVIMKETLTWYECARTLKIPRTTDNPFASLDDLQNPPFRTIATEAIFIYWHPDFPRVPIVGQIDRLLFDESTNLLWIVDYKFTGGSRNFRALTCPIEYQTRTYLTLIEGTLPDLITKYELPANTRLGGMKHVIIAMPTIGFGMKDRTYKWVSEGKKSGKSGSVVQQAKGWVGSVQDTKRSAVVFLNGDGITEDEAKEWLHTETEKAPEKEFSGEPSWEMYSKRVMDWYRGRGEHVKNSVDFDIDPPLLISTTRMDALDADARIEWGHITRTLYGWASSRHPKPNDFARTSDGMRAYKSDRASPYADFHTSPVSSWPKIMRDNMLVIKPRDREIWEQHRNGVYETNG